MEPKNDQNRTKPLTAASKWLAVFLADGERPASEAYAAGQEAGFSESQLNRGRSRLGVKSRKIGFPPKIFWRLAEEAMPPNEAEAWLSAFLANGECSASDVFAAGQEAGFSRKQLKNARSRLGAQFRLLGYPALSHWRLADATPSDRTPWVRFQGVGVNSAGRIRPTPTTTREIDDSATIPPEVEPAATWLAEFLQTRERSVAEVLTAWKAAGFPESQLDIARRSIGVKIRDVARPPWSIWRLDDRKGPR